MEISPLPFISSMYPNKLATLLRSSVANEFRILFFLFSFLANLKFIHAHKRIELLYFNILFCIFTCKNENLLNIENLYILIIK